MRTLVLVPGLGSDAAVWRRTIAALQLGDGEAECVVGDTLSDDTLAGMARRILERAPEGFDLAGVSMGGMVALEMTRIAPDRVLRLALVDTVARPDRFRRKLFRRLTNAVIAMSGDFGRLAERSVGSLVASSAPDDVRSELLEMSIRVGPSAYIRQNRAVIGRGDQRTLLPGITVPTTVIVGQEDRLTPVAFSTEIHTLTPGSTLHVVPDCGHLPPIEKPDVMAGLLRELLQRPSRSGF